MWRQEFFSPLFGCKIVYLEFMAFDWSLLNNAFEQHFMTSLFDAT